MSPISSIPEFVSLVTKDAKKWGEVFPWFRGEPAGTPKKTSLLPKLYRPPRTGYHYDENNLLQTFRRRAHLLGLPIVPERSEVDKWLYLARHCGLPTRLLDWTEGALIALYFALLPKEPRSGRKVKSDPVVWMLNPNQLNKLQWPDSAPNVFPMAWTLGPGGSDTAGGLS